MNFVKHASDILKIIIIVILALSVADNMRSIKRLKINLNQTKENLYQTNQVISEMQKDFYEHTYVQSK